MGARPYVPENEPRYGVRIRKRTKITKPATIHFAFHCVTGKWVKYERRREIRVLFFSWSNLSTVKRSKPENRQIREWPIVGPLGTSRKAPQLSEARAERSAGQLARHLLIQSSDATFIIVKPVSDQLILLISQQL
jgi:hypothetical protein